MIKQEKSIDLHDLLRSVTEEVLDENNTHDDETSQATYILTEMSEPSERDRPQMLPPNSIDKLLSIKGVIEP